MAIKKTSSVKQTKSSTPLRKTPKTNNKNIKVFSSSPVKASAKSTNSPIITVVAKQAVDNINDKLELNPYTKEVVTDYPTVIKKSQNHLIGLVKLYEGNPENNYEGFTATYRDKGKGKTKTNGFGSTTNLKITTLEEAYLQLEKDLVKANKAVIKTVNDDLKLGKGFFESLPTSIREGLIDLCFNKGPGVISQNKELTEAIKNKNYGKIIENLSFLYSIHDKEKKHPLPGLYRRSLSRMILAARDLSGDALVQANKAIDNLYKKALVCYKENNLNNTKELDDVYSYYKSKGLSEAKSVNETAKENSNIKADSRPTSTAGTNGQNYSTGTFIVDDSLKGRGAWGVAKVTYDKQDSSKMTFKEYYEIFNKINSKEVLDNIKVGTEVKIPIISGVQNTITQTDSSKTTAKKPEKKTQQKKSAPKKISTKKPVSAKKVVIKKNNNLEKEIKSKSENFVSRFFKGFFNSSGNKKTSQTKHNNKAEDIEKYGMDNDPNATPFNHLMNDRNKKITRNKVVVKTPNGKSRTYTTYTISLDYTVKKYEKGSNETVWGISHRYGMNLNNFCENNNITDSTYIQAGQVVKIQKLGYMVENGDSIENISKKFGLTPDILMQLNEIDEGETSKLTPGKMIELPGFIYKVKKGETFESIAKRVGVDAKILRYINGNKLNKEIRVIYNNPDYDKVIQSVKVSSINGKRLKKYDMSGKYKEVATREHLRYKTTTENGLVVANRAEFAPTNPNGKLKGKTIIVNAGHGYSQAGRDPGAVMEKDGLNHEWILNYDNSMKLIAKLQAQGARVIYLQGHKFLIQKALKQPENKGDLFISVHANIGKGDDTTRDRTQFYYREQVQSGEAKENSKLFTKIAERIFNIKYKSDKYAEVSTNDDRTGLLKTPINNQKIAGIIWEVAFMDSPKGRKRLKDNTTMNDYAYLMSQAVVKYFENIDAKKN